MSIVSDRRAFGDTLAQAAVLAATQAEGAGGNAGASRAVILRGEAIGKGTPFDEQPFWLLRESSWPSFTLFKSRLLAG